MRRFGVLPVGLLILCTVAAIAAVVVRGDLFSGDSRWKSFHLLLVSTDYDIEEIHAALSRAGLQPLDMANATVRVEDFNGQETIPVAQLGERFDDADPRVDPFVQRVHELFITRHGNGAHHLIYLPRTVASTAPSRAIQAALGPIPFILNDRSGEASLLLSGIGIAVMLGVLFFSRQRLFPGLLIIAVAAIYMVLHGTPVLSRSILTALAAIYLVRHSETVEREWFLYDRTERFHSDYYQALRLFFIAASLSVLSVVVESGEERFQSLISYTLYALAQVGMYGISVTVRGYLLRQREHRLFAPRPILGEMWRHRQKLPELFPGLVVVVPLLIVLVAVFHLFGDRFTTQGDLFVPLPDHHITELQFSGSPGEAEQLLAVLTQGEAEQKPLSTAGFVAHRRYQRSLLYGGAYEVPSAGEAVGLTRFRRAGDRIETWEEEVLRFDGEWVLNEFDVPDDSAYSLFVREGGAFFVRWESLGSVLLTRQSMIAQILLLFAFLIPLFTPFGLPYRTGLGTVAVASRSARR